MPLRTSHTSGVILAGLLALGSCTLAYDTAQLRGEPLPPVQDGGSDAGVTDDASIDGGDDAGGESGTWAHSRVVTLNSDASGPPADYAVLVPFVPPFNYDNTRPNGADLRFSASPDGPDLPYFVEAWNPGGESLVWVRVPSVPAGSSAIYTYYGNPSASARSDFAATFPRALRTKGGGSGSFAAAGDIDVDWFELSAGDALTLKAGTALTIRARRIILAGTVDGVGRGYGGAAAGTHPGTGPGAGNAPGAVGEDGASGAGYGGAGGAAGADDTTAAAPGTVYGTSTGDDIAMGSGGGSSKAAAGGAGGGALSVFGWRTSATGIIRVDGAGGEGGKLYGGGGAGGGLLFAAHRLELAGARLSANGGAGGACATADADGGGGGGGGRIKLRRRANGAFTSPTATTVTLGPAGAGNGTTAPGAQGNAGTVHVNPASSLLTGVEATLGPELPH